MAKERDDLRPEDYVYQPTGRSADFEKCVTQIPPGHRVIKGWVDHVAPETLLAVHQAFEGQGIRVPQWSVNTHQYNSYMKEAGYGDLYPDYYKDYLPEKSFEHFIALQLLDLDPEDVFIDVASENSPVPEINSRLKGCKSYRQDIMYPAGLNGDRIGGNACEMPIPDRFASKVSLTCSLEHFEGDMDRRLFLELSRVLKPGGKVCVVPFYVFTSPANQIDPTVSVPNRVPLDKDATVYCAKGWGNRFARFYSAESFVDRICIPTQRFLDFEVFRIMNANEFPIGIYTRFALIARRKPREEFTPPAGGSFG